MWFYAVIIGLWVLTAGFSAWYIHRENQDAAQIASDTLSETPDVKSSIKLESNLNKINQEKASLQKRLVFERRRLIQLQNSLADLQALQLTADVIKTRIQESTTHLRELEDLVSHNLTDNVLVNQDEQTLQRQYEFQKNTQLIDLENQIQNLNNDILNLQNQIYQLRTIAKEQDPSLQIQSLEVQLAQLNQQRTQTQSQIKIVELESDNQRLQVSQEAQDQQNEIWTERTDLQNRIADFESDLTYWKRQQTAVGDESLRSQRIQVLQKQITEQQKLISNLEQRFQKLNEQVISAVSR